MAKKDKLSTDPYKGVRDFYPEDMRLQNYLFAVMRQAVEKFGYLEYTASPLERVELYRDKTSREIVDEQMYHFEDKGGRQIALRPEMTPTVARMIAGRYKELALPARWYSIPNVFRYENPQRGRLREHYQLNVDLFGGQEQAGHEEMLLVVSEIMSSFGARSSDYLIQISDRRILERLFAYWQIPPERQPAVSKILDKKNKLTEAEFQKQITAEIGQSAATGLLETLKNSQTTLDTLEPDNPDLQELIELMDRLKRLNVTNVVFEPTLVRGFDYYTGLVFEVLDTHPDNRRSIFGGGRYDSLTTVFGAPAVPAVGFGMGDVSIRNFLDSHGLLPELPSPIDLTVICLTPELLESAQLAARELRASGLNVELDIAERKPTEKIKRAVKNRVPFALFLGTKEKTEGYYTLKDLETKTEHQLGLPAVIDAVLKKTRHLTDR